MYIFLWIELVVKNKLLLCLLVFSYGPSCIYFHSAPQNFHTAHPGEIFTGPLPSKDPWISFLSELDGLKFPGFWRGWLKFILFSEALMLSSSHVSISLSEFLHSEFPKWPSLSRFKLIMFPCHRHFQPTSLNFATFEKVQIFPEIPPPSDAEYEIYPRPVTNQSN